MPVVQEFSGRFRVACFVAVAVSLIAVRLAIAQQPGLLVFRGRPPQTELTAPQVNSISGATASRLEQARALVAAGSWDEAVEIYRQLSGDTTDRVVPLGEDRYVSLRTYCQIQLARMPETGLDVYRRRVDPLAEGLVSRRLCRSRCAVAESSCGAKLLQRLGR